MDATQAPSASVATASTTIRLPKALVLGFVVGLGAILGIDAAVSVETARPGDSTMLHLWAWLLYPGVIAIVVVRSNVELLATGLAATVPIGVFAVIHGADRMQSMGIGVPLSWALLLLVGMWPASAFARRPGRGWAIGAVIVGACSVIVAILLFIFLISLTMWM